MSKNEHCKLKLR